MDSYFQNPVKELDKHDELNTFTGFKAVVYILATDEGGRDTPFFNNHQPRFYFQNADFTGRIRLPEGVEMVMPSDNLSLEVELVASTALKIGSRFEIREKGKTIGVGVVTKGL